MPQLDGTLAAEGLVDGQTCGLATGGLLGRGLEGRGVVHPPPESLNALHIAVLITVLMVVSKAVPIPPLRRAARQPVTADCSLLVHLHWVGAPPRRQPLDPAPKKQVASPSGTPRYRHHSCCKAASCRHDPPKRRADKGGGRHVLGLIGQRCWPGMDALPRVGMFNLFLDDILEFKFDFLWYRGLLF